HYTINKIGFNPGVAGLTALPEARMTYRSQWVGLKDAPSTQILSLHGKYKDLPIGFGGYFYNDQVGKLRRTGGTAIVAIQHKINETTTASLGLGAGYYRIRLSDNYNARDLTDLSLAEASAGLGFPDFSAGIYIQSKGFFVGFSVPQILEPKLKFSDSNIAPKSALVRHYYTMLGYRFDLNPDLSLEPSGLVKYVDNAPLQYDVALRVFLKDLFWVGGSFRSDAAAAFMAGTDLNDRFLLAYAFDLTTSDLNTVSSGTHEITLGYRFGKAPDRDGDGIPDDKDQCPDKPGEKANNGCPTVPIATLDDRDKDGIRDDIDECPDIPGVASNRGCPVDDFDKDGIVDAHDKCPKVPGSFALQGCPGTDADGDLVADELDDCPDEPGPQYNRGCPLPTPNVVNNVESLDMDDFAIRDVFFDSDSDDIPAGFYEDLNKVAEFLVKHKEVKIQLSGHTDERASDEYNFALAKRRVESVMFYLINRGVDRHQIVADYYGEKKPLDPRKTPASYQLNRRVELRLLFN
ncbi:MAG: type IX secretion system membrane protein PorP/SprF, partial [Bacteroidetes bacterium]